MYRHIVQLMYVLSMHIIYISMYSTVWYAAYGIRAQLCPSVRSLHIWRTSAAVPDTTYEASVSKTYIDVTQNKCWPKHCLRCHDLTLGAQSNQDVNLPCNEMQTHVDFNMFWKCLKPIWKCIPKKYPKKNVAQKSESLRCCKIFGL